MNLLLLIGALGALAGAPALYTGDPAEAEARVRKASRDRGLEVELRRLVDVAPGADPYVVGQPAVTRCAPGRLSVVREGVENAEALLSRSADAAVALDLARLDLECLGEPVDPELAARLFYLRGFLAWRRSGDTDTAESAFYRAFLFAPTLSWDVELGGPRAPSSFLSAAARAASPPSAWLRVVPDPAPGFTLRIDGHARAPEGGRVPLRPGVHLVQVVADGFTAPPIVVPVNPGEERALVLPVALSEALLSAMDAPAREALSVLLRAAWPDRVSYVTGPAGTWRFDPATSRWDPL